VILNTVIILFKDKKEEEIIQKYLTNYKSVYLFKNLELEYLIRFVNSVIADTKSCNALFKIMKVSISRKQTLREINNRLNQFS
jgi:hypothetical protein